MKDITEFKGQTLYIDINELDIQVADFENWIGYITWATLELIIDHATQNDPEVALRDNIEVKGTIEREYDGQTVDAQVPNILDCRSVDEDGFYVKLDTI